MRREGLQAQGSYKEVPRPSRGLALAATKRSLTVTLIIALDINKASLIVISRPIIFLLYIFL
jgi:hypothetical protein